MSLLLLGCSGATLSQYAQTWYNTIVANGGSISAATLATFDKYFFIPAANNGNILNQLDYLHIYVGTGSQTAANTNIISNQFNVTGVNSPTWADNTGYKSNGTSSYLNLNYNPSLNASKVGLNDNFFFVGCKNPTLGSTLRLMGETGDSKDTYIRITSGGTLQTRDMASSTGNGTLSSIVTSGYRFLAVMRNSSSNNYAINNTTVGSGSGISSSGLSSVNLWELNANSGGSPVAGEYDTNYHLYSGAGSSSFDYTNFQTIINNLFTQLGV